MTQSRVEELAKAEAEKRYKINTESNQIHRMNMEEDRKIFVDGFKAGYSSRGEDAVEFAEWVSENSWHREFDELFGYRWYQETESGISDYITGNELYKLFNPSSSPSK